MILRKVIHVKWSFKQFSSGILPYRYRNTIPKDARGTEPPDIYSEGSKFLPIHLLAYPLSYLFTYLSTKIPEPTYLSPGTYGHTQIERFSIECRENNPS